MMDTQLDLDALEQLLREACKQARAHGIKIRGGDFGIFRSADCWAVFDHERGICPLSAAILFTHSHSHEDIDAAIRHATGLAPFQFESFYAGFDAYEQWIGMDDDLFALGQSLRQAWEAGEL